MIYILYIYIYYIYIIYIYTYTYIHRSTYTDTCLHDLMLGCDGFEEWKESFLSQSPSLGPLVKQRCLFWLPQGLFHMDHSYTYKYIYIYIWYIYIYIYIIYIHIIYICIYVHILIHIIPYINTYILATPVRSSLRSGSQYSTMTWIRGEETSLYTGPVQLFPSLPMVQWIYLHKLIDGWWFPQYQRWSTLW